MSTPSPRSGKASDARASVPIRRSVAGALAGSAATWLSRELLSVRSDIGASPAALRAAGPRSQQWNGGRFRNEEPTSLPAGSSEESGSLLRDFALGRSAGRPDRAIPLDRTPLPAQAGSLAATWFGHSTVLLEVDGARVLTDPVWSRRVSPSQAVGPARLHPVPLPLADVPRLDAVVVSHDHYDHLDRTTIRALVAAQPHVVVAVPVGVAEHLRAWRVPEANIVELDWGDEVRVAGLTLTCTPARHFSGRFLQRDTTLWASWVVAGPTRSVFFGGDTGYTPQFAKIGATHGPFDLTLLPVGAYDPRWADIHMNPEEAVAAHDDLGGRGGAGGAGGLFLPVHWATFNLAFHPWSEPVERAVAACEGADVPIVVPRPGGRVDATRRVEADLWWR